MLFIIRANTSLVTLLYIAVNKLAIAESTGTLLNSVTSIMEQLSYLIYGFKTLIFK